MLGLFRKACSHHGPQIRRRPSPKAMRRPRSAAPRAIPVAMTSSPIPTIVSQRALCSVAAPPIPLSPEILPERFFGFVFFRRIAGDDRLVEALVEKLEDIEPPMQNRRLPRPMHAAGFLEPLERIAQLRLVRNRRAMDDLNLRIPYARIILAVEAIPIIRSEMLDAPHWQIALEMSIKRVLRFDLLDRRQDLFGARAIEKSAAKRLFILGDAKGSVANLAMPEFGDIRHRDHIDVEVNRAALEIAKRRNAPPQA